MGSISPITSMETTHAEDDNPRRASRGQDSCTTARGAEAYMCTTAVFGLNILLVPGVSNHPQLGHLLV